jgi:hypothetical protein
MVKDAGKHSSESHDQSTECRPELAGSIGLHCFPSTSIIQSNTLQDEVRSPLRKRIHRRREVSTELGR